MTDGLNGLFYSLSRVLNSLEKWLARRRCTESEFWLIVSTFHLFSHLLDGSILLGLFLWLWFCRGSRSSSLGTSFQEYTYAVLVFSHVPASVQGSWL